MKPFIIISITALSLTACDGIDYSSSDIDHVPPIDYSSTCFNNCGYNGTNMTAEKYFACNHEHYNREASSGCTQSMIDANSLYC
ncbi:hypothetical protein [Parasedimentitalea psychrophila]|uniref:Lipoprotein n=1 Tax=Parasedimentitalea psychrophila TaxID=2997337 RepID=A0A9Y2L3B8_9RHOB|nr:hypothetical protein [Parasedimentitalea psychrophila]WIY26119.1 hypothetical protein QPJ95_04095 [Parasedimentitalea psychrophila]